MAGLVSSPAMVMGNWSQEESSRATRSEIHGPTAGRDRDYFIGNSFTIRSSLWMYLDLQRCRRRQRRRNSEVFPPKYIEPRSLRTQLDFAFYPGGVEHLVAPGATWGNVRRHPTPTGLNMKCVETAIAFWFSGHPGRGMASH